MKIIHRFQRFALVLGLCAVGLRAEDVGVIKGNSVNVRGQPSLQGEVITQLDSGERVVILEEITANHADGGEPGQWFKIALPSNTPVWVHAMYIDPETKTITGSRLNIRGGPGEGYSVLGRLARGDAIEEIRRIGDWVEIETPLGTYAFVAASLVEKQTTPPEMPAVAMPKPTDTVPKEESSLPTPPVSQETDQDQVAPRPIEVASDAVIPPANAVETDSVAVPPVFPLDSQGDVAVQPRNDLTDTTTLAPDSPRRRVVIREGIVRRAVSIQAPTYYELASPQTGKVINYLYLDEEILSRLGTDLREFKDYLGRAIRITGEEGIDPRWPSIPVVDVETLKLIL